MPSNNLSIDKKVGAGVDGASVRTPTNVADHAVSRRLLLGASAVATMSLGATAANAQSFDTIKKGESNTSASDPGPRSKILEGLDPSAYMPPPTDHSSVQQFWQSFSQSHRRIQDGGWARQVNVTDFPISKQIAAVNMKLNGAAFASCTGTRPTNGH